MKAITAALLLAFSPAIAQEIPIQCNATHCLVPIGPFKLIVQAANRAAELERLCGWTK